MHKFHGLKYGISMVQIYSKHALLEHGAHQRHSKDQGGHHHKRAVTPNPNTPIGYFLLRNINLIAVFIVAGGAKTRIAQGFIALGDVVAIINTGSLKTPK